MKENADCGLRIAETGMTAEAQRFAIAEACGWTDIHKVCDIPSDTWGHHSDAIGWALVPDYLNDLNAMHEAEKYAAERLMNADQWEEFGRQLEKQHPSACATDTKGGIDYYDIASLITELTAAQHAEAFLRAIGKWS